MRWDALFADLEAELDAEAAAERRSEVADRIRGEYGRIRLLDRLQPSMRAGAPEVRLGVAGHDALGGTVIGLGADWLILGAAGVASGGEVLVPFASVCWIRGLSADSAEPGWEGPVAARLGLRIALRRLARDRAVLTVALSSGDTLAGRISRVGADYIELQDDVGAGFGGLGATAPFGAIAFLRRR